MSGCGVRLLSVPGVRVVYGGARDVRGSDGLIKQVSAIASGPKRVKDIRSDAAICLFKVVNQIR